MKRPRILTLFLLLLCIIHHIIFGYGLSNLTKNDPFPIFSTREPYNWHTNHAKWNIFTGDTLPPEVLSGGVSAFRQAADRGRNLDKDAVPIGDIKGRWNMLALTYDPTTAEVSPAIEQFLDTGPRPDLFPEFTDSQIEMITTTCIPLLSDPCYTDTNDNLGFFSVPGKYRKQGIRWDFALQIQEDIGVTFVGGVANIKNQACDFVQFCPETVTCLTVDSTGAGTEACILFDVDCTCLQYVELELMRKLKRIAKELDLDIYDFEKTNIEDVRLGAYWRHIFSSSIACPDVPCCLFIPFISGEVGLPFSEQMNNRQLFAIPFGNNGHASIGFVTGFNMVYRTWLEFGSEIGYTHFFPGIETNVPIPTQELQVGLIPFSADIRREPGNNWHFGATLTTPYFLPHLSFYAQYLYINHSPDDICILRDLRTQLTPEQREEHPFLVKKYERETKWDFQLLNLAINYEFCPEIIVGMAWQVPLRGRNTFRSTTVLLSIMGVC